MPAPEPLFDIRHFSTNELMAEPLRKELRTYIIIADLSDKDSPTTRMVEADLGAETLRKFYENPNFFSTAGVDKWARGQLVVYILGKDKEDLGKNIVRAFPRISERIKEHDKRQLTAQTYVNGKSGKVSKIVEQEFGVKMTIPGDYVVGVKKDNFIWLRKDNTQITSSIAIKSFPYRDKTQFELEGLIDMRDKLGFMVPSSSVGSFMRTNAVDLPVYTYQKEIAGHYAVESRGIWEMTDDFLGGPFINYAIIVDDKVLLIDGFVFAPGKDKRDHVQQLELIIESLEF